MYTNMATPLATVKEIDDLIARLPKVTTFQLRYPATILSQEELRWPFGIRDVSSKSEIYSSFETEELTDNGVKKVRRAIKLPLGMDNMKLPLSLDTVTECSHSKILRQGGIVHGYRLFSRGFGEYLELSIEDQTAMEQDWVNGAIGVHVAIAFSGESMARDQLCSDVYNITTLYKKKYDEMRSHFLQLAETPEMRERVREAQNAYR